MRRCKMGIEWIGMEKNRNVKVGGVGEGYVEKGKIKD